MTTTANVLVVEDERLIARGIEQRLKKMGYGVSGLASSGDAALALVNDTPPDIVLMDINLGIGKDGIETATEIRQKIDIPIIFLTAYSDEATIERAKSAEPFGYLLKPYEDRDLHTAIEIALYKHKIDARLKKNEQWLASTLGSIGDGVIATDPRGIVRLVNPVAAALTGWTEEEAIGRPIQEVFNIVNEDSRETVANPALTAMANGNTTLLEPNTILIAKDGTEYPVDDSGAPIVDNEGAVEGGVLVFRDITEQRRLKNLLHQAQKLEALGRLAGGISHDFNNILSIINGYTELLLQNTDDPAMRASLTSIAEAGQRGAALTNQILAFSRSNVMAKSEVDLNRTITEMSKMVQRLIGSDIAFSLKLSDDVTGIVINPAQVNQIILNLCMNARDAMPNGGDLTIATRRVTVDAALAREWPNAGPGDYALLEVIDTGMGMTPDVLERAFDPFFTTKAVGQGTGLGLATVYGIVHQSDGHMEVSSTRDKGTTFQLYFPVSSASPHETKAKTATPAARGTETILLVEDEPTLRGLAKTILERYGYLVLVAADGAEAIALAERYEGGIDLLLTDLVMPYYGGREVAETIVASRPKIQVLYMSGYTDDVILLKGIEAGTSNLLRKPFNMAELTSAVRKTLDDALTAHSGTSA